MDPRQGLLAGGVPLPPPRPPGVGLPPGYLGPKLGDVLREAIEEQRQNMARRPQRQEKGMAELGELKQDYPYGAGLPETSPSFPRPAGQLSIGGIDRAIGK